MSSSIPGPRDLPVSRYDLSTYWGRVLHSAELCDPRTLFTSPTALSHSVSLLRNYKQSPLPAPMTPDLWRAKQIVDATLHPDTGAPVFLPFRMSCYVFSNLIVTAGMLQPNLGTRGVLGWQIANQTLNVCINSANANKSSPMSWGAMGGCFAAAVGASCGVALGLGRVVRGMKEGNAKIVMGRLVPFAAVAVAGVVNVGLMRGGEIVSGIDVFPSRHGKDEHSEPTATVTKKATGGVTEEEKEEKSLGKSRCAAALAVGETAVSRVINATPIMVLPPLILVRLQKTKWWKQKYTIPVNLGLIFLTSVFALPLALGIFPQRQAVRADTLEPEFHGRGTGDHGLVEFNRGI